MHTTPHLVQNGHSAQVRGVLQHSSESDLAGIERTLPEDSTEMLVAC